MADRIATDALVKRWHDIVRCGDDLGNVPVPAGWIRPLLARLAAAERVVEAAREADKLPPARWDEAMMDISRALAAYDAARKEAGDA